MKAIIGGIVAMPFVVTAAHALLRRLMPDRATHQPRRFATEQDSIYRPRLATALKWVNSAVVSLRR